MRLTLDQIRHMDYGDMLTACYQRISEYDAHPPESEQELNVRIGRTLDELPDLHTFFLSAKAWFGHWVDSYAAEPGYGTRSPEYKGFKSRRDAMDDMARACRLRYEATSRKLTQISDEKNASQMPRTRG